ncbi:hypothetical protein BH09ACT5_BH09ACT5_12910 [soil metagenome]
MSIIRTPNESEATGLVAEIYEDDIRDLGYVPSHTRVMAVNPEAVKAFEQLIRAVAGPMSKRRYELVTLAAAGAIGSQSCRVAHSRKALKYMEEPEIAAVLRDFHDAGLSDAEVAMMEFAEKLSRDSASMTEADSQRLRDLGFDDREIVEIALAAAARNYYSRALHALAVEVDVPPDLPGALREALRV